MHSTGGATGGGQGVDRPLSFAHTHNNKKEEKREIKREKRGKGEERKGEKREKRRKKGEAK